MKVLVWLIGLIFVMFGVVYVALFTPIGNGIMQPYIEKELQKRTLLDTKLKKFLLGFSDYDIVIELDTENTVTFKGSYSLLGQSIKTDYKLVLNKVQNLKHLLQREAYGEVKAFGIAKGDKKQLAIYGDGVIASSDTRYHVELHDFHVSTLFAEMKNADIAELLALANEHKYAEGKVNIDINLKNMKPENLDGNVKVVSTTGKLNPTLIKQMYNIEVPNADFIMNLDAKIENKMITYTAKMDSSVVKVNSSGTIDKETLLTDAKYNIATQEIAIFNKITKQNFRGPFAIRGIVQGNKEKMEVYGSSNVANSDTKLKLTLKDMKVSALQGQMKDLNIAKALYFLNEKPYGDGSLTLNIKLDNLKKGQRSGTIVTAVTDGKVNTKYFNELKKFKSPMPETNFTLDSYSLIHDDVVESKINLVSNLAHIASQKTMYDMQTKYLDSDYVIDVKNMNKLYFVTQQHINTPLQAVGNIRKIKDTEITLKTKIAKGNVDAKILNDDITASLKSVDTLELAKILNYPQIYKSLLNAELVYNKANKSGNVKAAMSNGQFAKNEVFDLTHYYTKYNLYKEKFQGRVNANFTDEIAVASLNLQSNKSSISTQNAKLHMKKREIDAKLDVIANKHPIALTLKGDVNSPQVSIDAEELIKEKAKKEASDRINKFLNKFF